MNAMRREEEREVTGSGFFHPTTFTLDNGMEVVLVENHRAPVVAHWVWYRVGTADSPPGKSGLPHYLEHLMFKGTAKIPPGMFSKIVARLGGEDNAMTGYDFTAYFQMIARRHLATVMEMEADRMVNLRLSEEDCLTERDVIVEERRQRIDNDPAALLDERLTAVRYLHHPYRLPVIGWMHEIRSYTREDALDFYRTWYAPNNAVLIVVGDITREELEPLAARIYGAIPARPVPERRRVQEPEPQTRRIVELADARVRQPSVAVSFLAPGTRDGSPERTHALEVLADLLGGGTTSRLYRSLVVERAIAASAGCWYRSASLDTSTFRLWASPRPGVDPQEVEAALFEEITRIREEAPGEEEVARVRRRMVAEATYAKDSLNGIARIFGTTLTTGGTVADVEAWPELIRRVTPEQVHAEARAVLDPDLAVIGRLRAKPEERA
ncbi:putative zinc protease [bacterium HR39]|nr:putative zinc protease [bacterium HR39]